jgi:hypothetical protein
MRVDLHLHTTASDGTFTPAEVIAEARAAGLGLIAVSDHDTTQHVLETETLARAAGLGFLRALELSSADGGLLLHVLAYGVDLDDAPLQAYARRNREAMDAVGVRCLESLAQRGFAVDLAAYAGYAHDPTRGGWRLINFLLDAGVCASVDDFFRRLFPGRLAEVFPEYPLPAEAIARIRGAGGTPILAHPWGSTRALAPEEREALLEELVGLGLAGLECHSSYHRGEETRRARDFCERRGLLITGGSDCHGRFTPERHVGQPAVTLADLRLGGLLEA